MPIVLNLPPDVEERLKNAAQQLGVTPEEHAISVLHTHIALTPRQRAENFQTWLQQLHDKGDEEGDCSWDEILRRIDESRGEARKLYPPEMKGISW